MDPDSPESLPLEDAAAAGERSGSSFGITEWGRGYWVRVLTASLAGLLVAATAGWLWRELEAVALPTPRWTLPLEEATGVPAPGQTVTLARAEGTGEPVTLATAVVEKFDADGTTSGRLTVKSVQTVGSADLLNTNRVSAPGAFTAGVSRPAGIPVFEKVYLQAGAALTVLLVGLGLIYYYVGAQRRSVEFLVATDGEMKKVNWSTRKVIWDSTTVVIGALFLIAAMIFLVDLIFYRVAHAAGLF